jgi:hypothetical protein
MSLFPVAEGIHGILKLLFASDVSLRCLYGSVAEQKLNLLEFASATMAQPGAGTAKIGVPDCLCRPVRRTVSPRT